MTRNSYFAGRKLLADKNTLDLSSVFCMGKKLAQRVLIVGSGSLFDEGLRRLLLREQPHLEVSSVIYRNDADFLQHVLQQLPTVVVLFEGGPLSVRRVFELMGDIPGITTTLRVITVLAETSAVEVYEHEQTTTVATTRGGDFIDLIERNELDTSNTQP